MDSNITSVLTGFLRILKIPVTSNTILEEVNRHPDSPSIATISDLFDKWKMPNGAYQLTVEDLNEVPIPFITHLNSNNGEFALITGVEPAHIIASNENWKNHKISIDSFKKIFSGTILLAERDEKSGEPDYESKRLKQQWDAFRLPALCLSITLWLVFSLYEKSVISSVVLILLILKSIGLLTSVLLLVQHVDSGNLWIKRICNTGKKISCNSILLSKQSKPFGIISWAELGFFYFASTYVFLIVNVSNPASLSLLTVLSLIVLPYTVYSIYFQAFIAKKWCIMCCIVQAIFWMEFLISMRAPFFLGKIPLNATIELLIYLFLIASSWLFIKPFLQKAQELPSIKSQLFQTKYNVDYFWSLLERQNKVLALDEHASIVIGNLEAEYTITMAANINCGPCAEAHQVLEKWLEEAGRFKLQIIFLTTNSDEDPRRKVVAHLMALYRENQDIMRQALNDWYNRADKNYHTWSLKYPVKVTNADIHSVQLQNAWSISSKVEFTPTLFINGSKVPASFRAEELKYFI